MLWKFMKKNMPFIRERGRERLFKLKHRKKRGVEMRVLYLLQPEGQMIVKKKKSNSRPVRAAEFRRRLNSEPTAYLLN